MRPFAQTETANTPTALRLDATTQQFYSAVLQQNPVREKLNAALAALNGGYHGVF